MPQQITVHVAALVEAAEREVETLDVGDAVMLHGREDTVPSISGIFGAGPRWSHSRRVSLPARYARILGRSARQISQAGVCAGQALCLRRRARSALATQTVQRMGLQPVAHIKGGFGAWKAAGGPEDRNEESVSYPMIFEPEI